MNKRTKEHLRKELSADVLTLSKDGVFTAKWSFFCSDGTHGKTAGRCANKVQEVLPSASILDCGNHILNSFISEFDEGAKAGNPRDSYFWVTFTI